MHRHMLVLVGLVIGLGMVVGGYRAWGAQPTVGAHTAVVHARAAEPAAQAAPSNERAAAPAAQAGPSDERAVTADSAPASIHLPDALEGLDTTDRRIAMMLCLDKY